jgi:hypothetical protein
MFGAVKQKFKVAHMWDLISDSHPLPKPLKWIIAWATTFTLLVVWTAYLRFKVFRSLCNYVLEGATLLIFNCSRADLQFETVTYRDGAVTVEREPLFLR